MGTAVDERLLNQLESRKKFIRKPYDAKLAFKRRKSPYHRLPFIGKGCWDVPQTGGYSGGCITGEALAVLYLKYLRDKDSYPVGSLQNIVLAMLDVPNDPDSPELDSVRGQLVGFLSVLDVWAANAAKILGPNLDDVDPKKMLKLANAGLNFDDKAWMDSLSDDD